MKTHILQERERGYSTFFSQLSPGKLGFFLRGEFLHSGEASILRSVSKLLPALTVANELKCMHINSYSGRKGREVA